jgi:hypothetical protein
MATKCIRNHVIWLSSHSGIAVSKPLLIGTLL